MVSHGHLDHAGGAKFLQERFGARLLMSAADYDLLDRDNPSWKPKRDMVVTDGQQLTLGDTTLTFYITPGHTEGTISTIFPVRDGNRRHVVAEWGGTLFNFGPIRPRLQAYAASAERFKQLAAKAGADVILSNHTVYDGSKTKLPAVQARRPGQPHPYVVGPQRRAALPHDGGRVRAGGGSGLAAELTSVWRFASARPVITSFRLASNLRAKAGVPS